MPLSKYMDGKVQHSGVEPGDRPVPDSIALPLCCLTEVEYRGEAITADFSDFCPVVVFRFSSMLRAAKSRVLFGIRLSVTPYLLLINAL